MMGGTIEQRSEEGSLDLPVHPVALSSFYIGKTEVTRQLWKAVMGEDKGNWMIDDLPVEWVSWEECQVFIQRLNEMTGEQFRLPTEAEWEYAARGGKNAGQQYRFAGSRNYEEVAWLYLNSENRTHSVGTKKPNQLGLYDMTGNVWEWCQDWFGPYSEEAQIDPRGLREERIVNGEKQGKVVRGSSWDNSTLNTRISVREGRDPNYSFYDCGLRLAMDGEKIGESEKESFRELDRKRKFKPAKVKWDKDSTVAKIKTAGQTIVMRRVEGSRYAIGEVEVTQALWKAVMGKKYPIEPSTAGNNLPMDNLSYNDCRLFLYKLDSISGLHFRLPTSREWEFAAEGGAVGIRYQDSINAYFSQKVGGKKLASYKDIQKQKKLNEARNLFRGFTFGMLKEKELADDATIALYDGPKSRGAYTYAGSDVALEVGWIAPNSQGVIHPVGKLQANELGLYDMTGNVSEWTSTQTKEGEMVLRGGCFLSNIDLSRISHIVTQAPQQRSEQCGMRLVLDL